MRNVTLAAIVSCVVFGVVCQGQVPPDVPNNLYDIGIVSEKAEVVPDDKGDVLVVIGAKWCRPCMVMYPQWKILRGQGYRVVYIDYDKPVWTKEEDKEIVEKFWEARDKSVPDVFLYNTNTENVVDEWHQRVGLNTVKKDLWKPSSSTGLVPEFSR